MKTTSLKKITIIAERLLREQILNVIRSEGATGFTLTAVEGSGSRGVHATDFEGRHVQIESIVSPAVADQILTQVEAEFLENYAVIAYLSDVEVLRQDKFSEPDHSEPTE